MRLRYGPIELDYQYDRLDPLYDQPGPIRRGDLTWRRFFEGAAVFAVIVVVVLLASLTYGEPVR